MSLSENKTKHVSSIVLFKAETKALTTVMPCNTRHCKSPAALVNGDLYNDLHEREGERGTDKKRERERDEERRDREKDKEREKLR